ncbi:hypothetical protein HOY80DRAFT_1141467 [Tuber brumale]|nr:hypothetical protein HOY80DRAFT_1141467 [Tuber brumale]
MMGYLGIILLHGLASHQVLFSFFQKSDHRKMSIMKRGKIGRERGRKDCGKCSGDTSIYITPHFISCHSPSCHREMLTIKECMQLPINGYRVIRSVLRWK